MKNYYQLLGVTERATNSEIQLAYTNMYQKCLLDKSSGSNVEEKLIDILVAYNALTNIKIKKEYNKVLNSDVAYDNAMPMQDQNVSASNNWLKTNIMSIVSITMLIAVFAYTIVLLASYVDNNRQTTIASTKIKHAINEKIPVKATNQKSVKNQKTNAYIAIKPVAPKQSITIIQVPKPTLKNITASPEILSKTTLLTTNKEALLNTNPQIVKQGSVKGEVLKVRGTPNAIVRFDNQNEIWCYSDEKISFSNGIATHIQAN